jgi:integrating conjugative element protein (TIGR03761 family)
MAPATPAETPPSRALSKDADPAVDYATTAVSPGTLRGDARLAIQTRQAQRLVHGRRHTNDTPGIIGLVQFGNLMRRIWTAAAADDPYADWALLRVHDALDAGRTTIAALSTDVETLLQAHAGVSIQIAYSLQPIEVPLQFANPYGYMGAYLIADFDTLVRGVLTVRHVGLLARVDAERVLNTAASAVRSAFARATTWKYCAVTRSDMRQSTQRAARAQQVMGDLPHNILEGTRRASHAPEIRTLDQRLEALRALPDAQTIRLSNADSDASPP